MRVRIHHHLWHYIVLFLILAIAIMTFLLFRGNSGREFFIVVLTAISYTLWGVFHHLHDGDLNWKIVVEYSLISVFITSVLGAFLFL